MLGWPARRHHQHNGMFATFVNRSAVHPVDTSRGRCVGCAGNTAERTRVRRTHSCRWWARVLRLRRKGSRRFPIEVATCNMSASVGRDGGVGATPFLPPRRPEAFLCIWEFVRVPLS